MENRLSSSGRFSQDVRHWRSSGRSKKICKIETLNLRILKIGSSSCQMFNDVDWTKKRNSERCISNSGRFKNCGKQFSKGHRTFLSPGDEKKRYGTLSYTLEGKWDSIATQMMERFKESRHPVVKSISALSRGILKRKKNRDTVHINADASNTELLFRTIHSALSTYGAVSSWCGESAQRTPSPQKESTWEKFVAKEILWCKLQGAIIGHLETDCENVLRDVKH